MSSLRLQLCFWVAKCQNKEKKGCIQILHGTEYDDVIRGLAGAATRRKNHRLPAWVLSAPAPVAALTPGQQLGQRQGENMGSEVSSSSRASEEENPVHEILKVFAKVLAAGPWAPCEQMVLSRPIWIGDSQMLPLGPCAIWRNMLLCSFSWDRNSSNILSKCS